MVGPCWGQGKHGPVLISDVQGVQELFVGSTSLSLPLTAADFPVAKQRDQPGSVCLSQGSACLWILLEGLGQEPLQFSGPHLAPFL